ncbi:MAG: hydrogenase nickel incorporation protein HypA/HybF [Desulfovibrionales bacterium]|jgi:hydrogenase nickel incorporation protein HypA/HybF|nr:hydrogenase nickel incorporation protein HypA/HybF [Desulfovibrionales bacterium]
MHEMSVAQSILEIIRQELGKHGLSRLDTVVVKAGRLAGIVPDALLFAWEVLTKDDEFDGSKLVIEEIPLVLRCGSCGEEFTSETNMLFPCPRCGEELGHAILSGREMYIEKVEAE